MDERTVRPVNPADAYGRAAAVEIELVEPGSPAARRALTQYFAELDERFRCGFDPGTGGAPADAESLRRPDGAFLVVVADREPIGCGALQRVDDGTAEIKRMWIDGRWRGLGLGRRLLARLEDVARELGQSRIVLDTNETLTEAIAMYGQAGYRPIARYNDNPYAHHWFAKDL